MGKAGIFYIIGTYPDFSTTFIDREVRMLRQWGLDIGLLSIRQPVLRDALSQEQRGLERDVIYLIPVQWKTFWAAHLYFLLTRPLTCVGTLLYLLTRPRVKFRDRVMTTLHFAEGVYAAYLLRKRHARHLHAHFVERAATVALVAGRLLGIPYSLAVHAGEDIYVHPVLLPEKFGAASFVISCTQYNLDYLRQQGLAGLDGKAFCIHHGLDVGAYPPATHSHRPPLILAVGRLVEKKGLDYLIRACRLLKEEGREFVCHIVGPGPDRARLEALIGALNLQSEVRLCGGMPHEQVIEEYRQATLFALPAVQGQDGSLDGIPNVLAEAMAMELPVVTTTISAIPELIEDQVNGLLVPPRDEEALARALGRLLDDAALRARLGRRGRQTVLEQFDLERNVRRVHDLLRERGGQARC